MEEEDRLDEERRRCTRDKRGEMRMRRGRVGEKERERSKKDKGFEYEARRK